MRIRSGIKDSIQKHIVKVMEACWDPDSLNYKPILQSGNKILYITTWTTYLDVNNDTGDLITSAVHNSKLVTIY